MYVIGLTGNIGTGKSTVAEMLAGLGARVIDADTLAHQAMQAGTPTQQLVIAEFGCEVVRPDGEIDRMQLGARVFSDPSALARLEAIVHPVVVAEAERLIAQPDSGTRIVVLEAIKLLESGTFGQRCDEIWVVTCQRDQQVERLMTTRGLSRGEAELRVNAQPPQQQKVDQADVVVDNSGTLEQTRAQVEREWKRVLLVRDHGKDYRQPSGGSMTLLRKWIDEHPFATMWAVLAVGMVVIFWLTSGDAGLRLSQRLFMASVCVLLAGVCTWIVSWE